MTESAVGKVYKSAECEAYWYKTWKESDLFRAENESGQPSFSILLPPSNGTRNLQLMQGLTFTIADIIIRRKKMQGFNTLYLPGLDSSGSDAQLASRLGLALDWGRVQWALNMDMKKTVARIFVQLYKEGNIYRGDYSSSIDLRGKSRSVGEPNVSKQWFLKTAGLAKPAMDAVEKGEITFIPGIGGKEFFYWMGNIRDWCISRQLPVGYRIPAYYCADCHHIMVVEENPGKCDRCHSMFITQDPGVLDTYFSSALWPLAALQWPGQSQDFKHFYPTSLLVVNPDMIFWQAARMIMMGIHIGKNIPFSEVLISSRIRGEKGHTVSKTPKNIGTLDMIDEYGADALRFALATLAVPGRDTTLTMDRLKGYKTFVNKIWNASRYVLDHIKGDDDLALENFTVDFAKITAVDRWILNGLNNMVVKMNDLLDAYKLHKAANLISHFFRYEYCNWYLEFAKNDMDNPNTRKTLGFTLFRLLQLLHPFMPFITEEINYMLNPGKTRFLIRYALPTFSSDLVFPGEFAEVEVLKKVIKEARKTRTVNRIAPKTGIAFFLKPESGKEKTILAKNIRYFDRLAGSSGTQIVTDFTGLPRGFKATCPNWEILLPLINDDHRLNVLSQLEREAENLDRQIAGLENKLTGTGVMDKALGPEIAGFKKNLRVSLNLRDKIRKTINDLS
ncbi:MAG TPA: class I tRNA ligase family protein [Candidatus Deferrimicrobium sp.]|nr:class I tRNA ligase family protein [Candidatus Deferrimicrobium sp.]